MFTEKEIDVLNLIRWLSTIAIVVCHILQGYNNSWAYVFNLGVQIFFFLSGFLYGKKRLDAIVNFYRKRIIKLYIPYLLWVFISSVALVFVANQHFGTSQLFNLVILRDTISGLGHLWFMKILFLCYLFLPVVNLIIDKFKSKGLVVTLVLFTLLVIIKPTSTLIWISVYYCGFICGRYKLLQTPIMAISFAVSLVLVLFCDFSLDKLKDQDIIVYIAKSTMAIFIFLISFKGLTNFKFKKQVSHMLTIGGGYELYLTHGLFILGPISVLELTSSNPFNILVAIVLSIFSAYLLCISSKWITSGINNLSINGVIKKYK